MTLMTTLRPFSALHLLIRLQCLERFYGWPAALSLRPGIADAAFSGVWLQLLSVACVG